MTGSATEDGGDAVAPGENINNCAVIDRLFERQAPTQLELGFRNFVANDAQQCFAAHLATCATLQYLNLEGNNYGTHGLTLLVQALISNQECGLKTLILRNNHLQPVAGPLLGRLLHQNTSLTTLDASHNALSEDGIIHIIESLLTNHNCQLQMLNLSHNNVASVNFHTLESALTLHQTLQINLLGNPIKSPYKTSVQAEPPKLMPTSPGSDIVLSQDGTPLMKPVTNRPFTSPSLVHPHPLSPRAGRSASLSSAPTGSGRFAISPSSAFRNITPSRASSAFSSPSISEGSRHKLDIELPAPNPSQLPLKQSPTAASPHPVDSPPGKLYPGHGPAVANGLPDQDPPAEFPTNERAGMGSETARVKARPVQSPRQTVTGPVPAVVHSRAVPGVGAPHAQGARDAADARASVRGAVKYGSPGVGARSSSTRRVTANTNRPGRLALAPDAPSPMTRSRSAPSTQRVSRTQAKPTTVPISSQGPSQHVDPDVGPGAAAPGSGSAPMAPPSTVEPPAGTPKRELPPEAATVPVNAASPPDAAAPVAAGSPRRNVRHAPGPPEDGSPAQPHGDGAGRFRSERELALEQEVQLATTAEERCEAQRRLILQLRADQEALAADLAKSGRLLQTVMGQLSAAQAKTEPSPSGPSESAAAPLTPPVNSPGAGAASPWHTLDTKLRLVRDCDEQTQRAVESVVRECNSKLDEILLTAQPAGAAARALNFGGEATFPTKQGLLVASYKAPARNMSPPRGRARSPVAAGAPASPYVPGAPGRNDFPVSAGGTSRKGDTEPRTVAPATVSYNAGAGAYSPSKSAAPHASARVGPDNRRASTGSIGSRRRSRGGSEDADSGAGGAGAAAASPHLGASATAPEGLWQVHAAPASPRAGAPAGYTSVPYRMDTVVGRPQAALYAGQSAGRRTRSLPSGSGAKRIDHSAPRVSTASVRGTAMMMQSPAGMQRRIRVL